MKLNCISFVAAVALPAVKLVESRNQKKGLGMFLAQTCGALERHFDVGWWFSWSHQDGYSKSFCDEPQTAVNNARANGLEFVPMLWNSVPDEPFDDETVDNLEAASYLMTFNEPEKAGQANLDPTTAAEMWPSVRDIAEAYDLEVVGPCMTDSGNGRAWYNNWHSACESLYNETCYTDFTCIHMYYHPYPCSSEVAKWACVRDGAAKVTNKINQWYNDYGKQIWVAEFACPNWGWADGGSRACSEDDQLALMEQVVPVLESKTEVFRYGWSSAYSVKWNGGPKALNEQTWAVDIPRGYSCANKELLATFGDAAGEIQAVHECVAAADSATECISPLVLSVDNQNCYCATETCTPSSDCQVTEDFNNCTQVEYNNANTKTYFEQDGLRQTNALTTLGKLYNGRNNKKGLAMHTAQTCGALDQHTDAGWWYSWSNLDGFSKGFCDEPQLAVNNARADGLEFVPEFWGSVPEQPLDAETVTNLQAASYVIGFNEPEKEGQANIDPSAAALMWPSLVAIANEYNLEVVGPCMTDGAKGLEWYANWTFACESLYNEPCHTDFTCIHMYYHPYDCSSGLAGWACVNDGAAKITNKIDQWYNAYGKPIWVTEFACPRWGWIDGESRACDEESQLAFMQQVVPVLESTTEVFRYAWFSVYGTSWNFDPAALNEKAWTVDLPKGYGCANKTLVAEFGDGDGQIRALYECVAAADNMPECISPLVLSVDRTRCYCATQTCSPSDCDTVENCTTVEYNHPQMKTYFEQLGLRETNSLTSVGTLYNAINENIL